MLALDCPWCSGPVLLADDVEDSLLICAECAVSAHIAPDPNTELAAAA